MLSRSKGLQSVATRRRKRVMFKVKLAVIGVFAILVLGGIIYVARLENIRIAVIYTDGNKFISDEDARELSRGVISGNYWFVFPKNNIFLYPSSLIEETFLKKYPEIEKVDVRFRDLESISISITERVPKALWCEEVLESTHCYLVTQNGFIFREAADYSSDLHVKFAGGISGQPIGSYALPSDEFKKVLDFIEKLERENIKITNVLSLSGGVREGEMSLGGKIIWNGDQDLALAFDNLKLLIDSPSFKGKNTDGTIYVEYIDIQNGDKIFFKPK